MCKVEKKGLCLWVTMYWLAHLHLFCFILEAIFKKVLKFTFWNNVMGWKE